MKKIAYALMVLALLVLAGCGGGEKPNPNGSSMPDSDDAVFCDEGDEGVGESAGGPETVPAGPDDPVAAVSTYTGEQFGYGYINTSGKWVITPQYMEACPFVDSVATVLTWDGVWRLIDKGNTIIAEFPADIVVEYDAEQDLHGFTSYHKAISEDRIIISKDSDSGDLYGVADTAGHIIVEPQYERIYPYSEGLAVVNLGDYEDYTGHYAYMDREGDIVIDGGFSYAFPFHEGRAWINIDPNYWDTSPYQYGGFIDNQGNLVIGYTQVPAGNGVAYVGYYGFYSNFYRGIAAARVAWADTSFTAYDKTDWCLGIIDVEGNVLKTMHGYGDDRSDLSVHHMEYSEGLCPIYGYYDATLGVFPVGFMDTVGDIVIEPQTEWDLADSIFSEGYCAVVKDDQYGYIDTSGAWAIPAQFKKAGDFTYGYAAVQDDELIYHYIDTDGNIVFSDLGELYGAEPFTK